MRGSHFVQGKVVFAQEVDLFGWFYETACVSEPVITAANRGVVRVALGARNVVDVVDFLFLCPC